MRRMHWFSIFTIKTRHSILRITRKAYIIYTLSLSAQEQGLAKEKYSVKVFDTLKQCITYNGKQVHQLTNKLFKWAGLVKVQVLEYNI